MSRLTGTWLGGDPQARRDDEWPGRRLGRPETGRGSVAGYAVRIGAFALDSIAANLVVGVVTVGGWRPGHTARTLLVTAAFLLIELLGIAAAGQTVGMRLLGLRVERVDGGRPRFGWVLVRTALLALVIPPVVVDRDVRGLHDRASGTLVARIR